MTHSILASMTLLSREMTRFFRQRNRVIGAFGSPLVFWVLIGAGMSSSFHPPGMPSGMTAIEYLFPGTMTLIILFTSIFSTISIIEDRREGFLQSVLVAPVSRSAIVFGKILGGTMIAVLQAIVFLLLAPLAHMHLSFIAVLESVGVAILLGFALTGLGFSIAWRMDSTQGFHAIMNLFLIPMWLLSGSFFPMSGAPTWLYWLMKLNPLTYGVAALRRTLYHAEVAISLDLPTLANCLLWTVLFGIVFFIVSLKMVNNRKVAHIK
jgi:ABC-2 type transport system permease protein